MNTATPKQSGNTRIIVLLVSLLLIAVGCVVGWLAKNASAESQFGSRKPAIIHPPANINLEPFTTNLLDEDGRRYVRASFTVQVSDKDQVEFFNSRLAQVRSQLLLALAARKPSELAGNEGKKELIREIHQGLSRTFSELGKPHLVQGVFLTSFVIQ